MREVAITVGTGKVSAAVFGEGATVVALAHGAGGDRRNRLLVAVAEEVARSGRCALLYNFPYREAGRGAPDRTPVLEETVRAAAAYARDALGAVRLVLGGRSMGGRMATHVAAQDAQAADGLVLLAYPLHPAGQPEKLRDAHLPRIAVPMLFVQGTRDALAQWELVEPLVTSLGEKATLHALAGRDHSMVKRGAAAVAEEADIAQVVLDWLGARRL